jgi:hypothetical protein
MMLIRDCPLPTQVYDHASDFAPEPGSMYVYGISVEARSHHADALAVAGTSVQFCKIVQQDSSEFVCQVEGAMRPVSLRSTKQLTDFWLMFGRRAAYLDITGLAHHVWAPLLRVRLSQTDEVKAVYLEPREYRFSATPTEGEIFDLSEQIQGIAPIPGFISLRNGFGDDVSFVPLLGFEGARLKHILEDVQPPGGKVMPVIGLPGFQPEYPFHTYLGNRLVLMETRAWKNVRFALANCPFSAYYTIQEIAAEHPNDLLKIAPIGTKPHALGAIMYAIVHQDRVELVYDHPMRKAERTEDVGRLFVYAISGFMKTLTP